MKLTVAAAVLAVVGQGANGAQLGARARALRSGAEMEPSPAVLAAAMVPTVPPIPKPWSIEPKRCVTGYFHVGCVKDTQFEMRRYYDKHIAKEDRVPMTVDVCWSFCRNVSGAQFFGLEMGRKCYCTPTFHSSGEVREEDVCDQPCEGDSTQMCGGDRQNQDMYEMHDCNNMPSLPCPQPPATVAHAKLFKSSYYRGAMVPCSNAQRDPLETGKNIRCKVECEKGFWVGENTLKCTEMGNRLTYSWAQILGSAICEPVNCGRPKRVLNAKYPLGDVEYPKNVTFACDLGHSTDGTAQGPKQQDATCQETGKFSPVTDCLPVKCGECPTGKKYANAEPRQEGVQVFKDFCTYVCAEGYTLNEHPDGEKMFDIACLHTGEFAEPPKCRPVKCGAAPALLHATATPPQPKGVEEVFQNKVPYTCEKGYSLDRKPVGNTTFELECLADGTFSDTPGCKAVLVGHPPVVNHSMYDDRAYFYGESCTYTCDAGYSMTGKVGGPMTQTLDTAPDATWAGATLVCLPVECGALPAVAHATAVSPPAGVMKYAAPPVTYVCDAGYSTSVDDDIWSPNHAEFFVTCKADGQFATKECVNIDDCLIRNCGTHGLCVDAPSPTDNLLDNYDCKCDSGYMVTLHNSTLMAGQLMKRCTNINDCPADACGGTNTKGLARGLCDDKINTYECSCGAGYEVAKNAAGNQTCSPISCGTLAAPGNATYTPASLVGGAVTYDTPPWMLDCSKGYSFDGQAGGPRSQETFCRSTGALTTAPACVRVSCGAPEFVLSADMAPSPPEMLYGDRVTYTCDEGHALKGDPKGLRVWEIVCLGSGMLSKPDTQPGGEPVVDKPTKMDPEIDTVDGRLKATVTITTTPVACMPVLCGVVPQQAHATWNETREYVYGEAAIIDCDDGYSIDGSTSDASGRHKAACTKDGTFSITAKCQRIQCSAPPTYKHSKYAPEQDPFKYGDKVTYTIEQGYELTLSNGSTVNGSFDCYCGSNGKFNQTCAMDAKVVAINCGTAPSVEHATVTGATHFGGMLLAKADVGYTVDGTAMGATNFTFWCQANGRFSPRQEFQRIVCGSCPDEANVEEIMLTDAAATLLQLHALRQNSSLPGLKTRDAHGATYAALHAEARRASSRSGKRLYVTKYGDVVAYACKEGYRAASAATVRSSPVKEVSPSAPGSFELTCAITGDHATLQASPADPKCLPVTCDIKAAGPTAAAFPNFKEAMKRLQYQEVMGYGCRPGFSLDGTPTGKLAFTETCQASGEMSKTNACKDIDWCLVSKCGDHGACVDGVNSYTCECERGYKVDVVDSSWQTCVQIDECDTQGGYGACSVGGGKCVDELLAYKCECPEGYENVKTSRGLDSCAPVLCPSLPVKENAFSPLMGQKLHFPQLAIYACNQGYSMDGTVAGQNVFQVSCAATGELTGLQGACKPVVCAAAQAAPHAAIVGENPVHFGQSVRYECEAGATTSGFAGGPGNFSVRCLATGELGPAETCQLVTCGAAPLASFAVAASTEAEVRYGEAVAYNCIEGFSVDGTAAAAKTFDATCGADGVFTGLQSCKAISCGTLAAGDMKLAQYPIGENRYPAMVAVACDTGATVDADPDGESTFFVQCGADGAYANKQDCKLVTCPVPASPKSHSTDKTGSVEYDTAVVFTCSAGYSTDGTPIGAMTFSKQCEASGSLSRSSPGACVDIDFCYDSPCGASGLCTDSGVGVPAPGYTCTCAEGFEVKPNGLGGTTCAADDCAGDPCGAGGSCTDLSKSGGAEGTYSCTCEAGYELVEPEPMKFTCKRRECGTLPEVAHTVPTDSDQPYLVTTKMGEPSGSLTLLSFQRATFECAPGYSTDQRTTPEGRTFSVSCMANGKFSRTVSQTSECLPIICDDPYLPSITHASVTDPGTITFGQTAEYRCHSGYTTDGSVNGSKSFSVECLANGTFADTNKQCMPVSCVVPEKENAVASRASLKYSETVTYTCGVGYHIVSGAGAHHTFEGTCTSDGSVSTSGAKCVPVDCGMVPPQPGVSTELPSESLTFGDSATLNCLDGYTLGGVHGGERTYQISCTSAGDLTGMIESVAGGPPVGKGVCQLAGFTVSGVVFDAQDPSTKLAEVKVTIMQGGNETAVVYTNAAGQYEARVVEGNVTMKAQKSGFIDREKGPIAVTGPLGSGQGTGIDMSKVLPENDWRVVLNWGQYPEDLDTHVEFGCAAEQHVYYGARTGTSERAGGIAVTLDTDDTSSWGPETTSIRGAGRCTTPGCCLIKFKVFKFSGSKTLGTSEATVTVFKGANRVGKYNVPPCLGSKRWWTVFTIDSSEGVNALHEGDILQPAYIDAATEAYKSWSLSFDTARWSTVTSSKNNAAVITAINLQSATRLHHLDGVKYMDLRDGQAAVEPRCEDVSFEGTLAEEQWAACPAGMFFNGFYRTGSKYDDLAGLEQLTKARCCSVNADADWGECHVEKVTTVPGWKECGESSSGVATAMVGLHATMIMDDTSRFAAYTGPMIRHASTQKGLYLGGNYIELGIRTDTSVGKFGTEEKVPAGFHGRPDGLKGIGMVGDSRGFANDPSGKQSVDYFLPGFPAEEFWVGYKSSGVKTDCTNCGETVEDLTMENGPIGAARITNTLSGNLKVVQNVTLGIEDKFFKTVLELTNVGSSRLDHVRFARTVDADNTVDQWGDFPTTMTIDATYAVDGYSVVSAKSKPNDPYYEATNGHQAVIMYMSQDPRAKVSFDPDGFLSANGVFDPYLFDTARPRGDTMTIDAWMGITFDFGTLGPGQTVTATYYTALDDSSISDIVKKLTTAAEEVLALDEVKCCSVARAMVPGPSQCAL